MKFSAKEVKFEMGGVGLTLVLVIWTSLEKRLQD